MVGTIGHAGDALALDQLQQLRRPEARQHHMPPAGQRIGEDAPAGRQMAKRSGMKLGRRRFQPGIHQGVHRIHEEIGVAQHHALGAARGAAGIEQRRQILPAAARIRRRRAAGDERLIGQRARRRRIAAPGDHGLQARHLGQEFSGPVGQGRIEDEGHGLGIAELGQDLGLAQPRVERDEDAAAPAGSVVELDAAMAVLAQHRDAVAAFHAEAAQRPRQPCDPVDELVPGEMPVA